MRRRKREYIKGSLNHRRTEGDYMAALLEVVTLDDWRAIVGAAITAALGGDSSARAWLAQYLVGKPSVVAPAPLTVVVQQLSGRDPVVDELASSHITKLQFPSSYDDEALGARIKDAIREELRLQDECKSDRAAATEQGS
jgi:hypothetical protein